MHRPTTQFAHAASPALSPAGAPLSQSEFATLESTLDSLRQRWKLTPCWEFCEGFMAALVCCRRHMGVAETLPVLLAGAAQGASLDTLFPSTTMQQTFLALWTRRWNAIALALDTPVRTLDDAAAYQPEVGDARALEPSRPALGQLWALGFLAAVKAWPAEWAGPRNKAAQHWRATTLGLLEALTRDDTDPPTLRAFADTEGVAPGPLTVSAARMAAFADAIWAIYSMRDTWRSLGPRVQTVRVDSGPGRNAPCSCGSGKKFKKCCGTGTPQTSH